tara:strand:- start:186 stop:329 length:144 start_codon:yes stop_codon:yes gene_type:complete
MIKVLLFTALLNTGELNMLPPNTIKVEARSRKGKGQRGRKRGGGGLR